MIIEPALLLERMAGTLRNEVGPAVEDPFARTQAFMASVVLAKLAGQLRADAASDALTDHATVADGLRDAAGDAAGDALAAPLADAVDALGADGTTARWNAVVVALYGERDALGEQMFQRLLGVLRSGLRARLDRALAYAR